MQGCLVSLHLGYVLSENKRFLIFRLKIIQRLLGSFSYGGNVVGNTHSLQLLYEHQNRSSSSLSNIGVVIEWPSR